MASRTLLAALAGAVSVSAHGYIDQVTINGEAYVGYNPSISPWEPDQNSIGWPNTATDLGFVAPSALQSPDIVCHRDSRNAPITAEVAAGSDIVLRWNQWPDSHHGPIMDYLANCNGDCSTVDKNQLEFFKIAEVGQLELGPGHGTPGYWAADELIANGNTWTVTIPSGIAPGNYVLRHEILALHSAYDQDGAQFYPQCINLKITGSGTQSPSGVPATELYTMTDPGVVYDIYGDQNSPVYEIPGPALFTG
ncbi:Endoglucanase-like protein [Hapsidospora chrysogenum ATCC 11550]|uniref:lytic cellulose monooxygenase (C4-dehydrogenating) n=1 Tax=Hapsidospora chrysogenum (strain ATCC 11550 / CBS 779.69 / DSM 880 / IAM 14645 / JCM 23072 / IMI 49137) TaxID=857340 RepID=A0A086SWP9_HAPC1|nr:Endoglucanase-like protein [Hapsidospora chrysogenum ATCC 11550]